jgi:hypothetical protein
MLYALADGAAEVDISHLHAAYALVNYARDTATHVLGADKTDHRLTKLMAALRTAGPTGMTRGEITTLFSRNLSAGQLDDLLAKVEATPGVTRSQRRGAGRPTTVWTLTPDEVNE